MMSATKHPFVIESNTKQILRYAQGDGFGAFSSLLA
jgi:hypothetical protein